MRKNALLTQREVGEKLGISQAAYCRLERGQTAISVLMLMDLCDMYGVPLLRVLQGI